MNRLGNTWAVILKTSASSWLFLVNKAKDKNKIKTYEQSADSDISLKCIFIGKLEETYNYHSGSYGFAFILKSK